jgi:hypothetical protein
MAVKARTKDTAFIFVMAPFGKGLTFQVSAASVEGMAQPHQLLVIASLFPHPPVITGRIHHGFCGRVQPSVFLLFHMGENRFA